MKLLPRYSRFFSPFLSCFHVIHSVSLEPYSSATLVTIANVSRWVSRAMHIFIQISRSQKLRRCATLPNSHPAFLIYMHYYTPLHLRSIAISTHLCIIYVTNVFTT